MKTPIQTLVDEVKNWSFDDWKILRDDPKLLMQILTTFQKAAPEEFNKLLSSVMVPPTMNNPEVNSILGEPTPTNTENLYMSPEELSRRREDDGPNEDSKNMAADIQAKLNKAATEEKINMASGAEPTPTPHPKWDEEEHFGEQQAEGLDNLLEGLRDTPHDNRW